MGFDERLFRHVICVGASTIKYSLPHSIRNSAVVKNCPNIGRASGNIIDSTWAIKRNERINLFEISFWNVVVCSAWAENVTVYLVSKLKSFFCVKIFSSMSDNTIPYLIKWWHFLHILNELQAYRNVCQRFLE